MKTQSGWAGGTDTEGYRLTPEYANRILRIEFVGLLSLELTNAYKADMLAAMKSMSGTPWVVLAEISRFPPQLPECAPVHANLMATAESLGMVHAASVVSKTLTEFQIRRLANEAGIGTSFHRSEAEARTALASILGQGGPAQR